MQVTSSESLSFLSSMPARQVLNDFGSISRFVFRFKRFRTFDDEPWYFRDMVNWY
jgi:hypothetical protein